MFEETEAKRQKDVLETNRDAPKPTTSSHLRKKFYESFKEEAVPVEPEANVNRVPQKVSNF